MSKILGLIGYPLEHSFSPSFFNQLFNEKGLTDYSYQLFPIKQIDEIVNVIKDTQSLMGLNVTIPYKQSVIPFLDDISDDAKQVGAVNTIVIKRDAKSVKLLGFNTDVVGLKKSIESLLLPHHTKALILGTGGASKAVQFVLDDLHIPYKFVTTKPVCNYNELSYAYINNNIIAEHKIIINTTPLGMFPNIDDCPDIPYKGIGTEHLLYDLVYNPQQTLFLQKGKEQGAIIKNGLQMLELQALASWNLFNE